ncbi:MAG TPA: hypothetical protein VNA15_10600 [Candidatus Angelobacter sp.]|nr:hypothetical protein [Candidatus Angelobacter sp.]
MQLAKLPRYGREGTVEVRPFTAKKKLRASEAQGLSGEAVKGNPTTNGNPPSRREQVQSSNNRRLDRTETYIFREPPPPPRRGRRNVAW